jgi:hypothetical protein
LLGLALAAAPLRAATPETSFVQPSLSLLGVSEHASGSGLASPDPFDRKLGMDVGFGLDGRQRIPKGWLDWSGFGLVHDALVDDDRSLFLAGRARGASRLGSRLRLRLDDSARYQRGDRTTLSDFQRNELSLGFEHLTSAAVTMGARFADRRRSVRGDDGQSFDRQSYLASLTWGRTGALWRLELGPQHYSTNGARGWRMLGTLEWAARTVRWTTGVRGTWLEPFDEGAGSNALFTTSPAAAPLPTAPRDTNPPAPPSETTPPNAVAAPIREGLLGPSLIVDPLEDDETDWDFGRRKQEIVGVAARGFGTRLTLTAELRVEIERGPDLLAAPTTIDVERERFAARLHARRAMGRRWTLLGQGGWQHLNDNRPGYGYSRGVFSLGIELRP